MMSPRQTMKRETEVGQQQLLMPGRERTIVVPHAWS